MTIKAGDHLPEGSFQTITADGSAVLTTDDVFKGKTVVLFAVPGAFTPTCHMNHLPGYVDHYATFKDKGVDTIAVLSVNDKYVMKAWQDATKADGKVLFLADGSADYVKKLGLELDATAGGMGMRAKRFAMLVKDGVVEHLNIEEDLGATTLSGAAAMLELL